MNYITYKQIDGTITSGFKVKLYDIVTLNTGYWKDKLAIVLYINEDKKQIKVRIIECGMNLTLKVKDVQFVNHNNKTAARSYIDLCNKLSKTFRDKYTDKQYIKDNWFTDKFIINDITADTIAKGIGQYITNTDSDRYSVSAIMWLSDIKDYIDAIGYILGVYVGCILFLIYEVFNLYKKIERINIDINKLQNKDIEFHRNIEFIINDSKYNKEVFGHLINKLNNLMIILKRKLMTSLLPSSTGGRHGA